MMLSKRWQGLTLMALAVTLSLAFALPAQAQRDTGIMSVRALDPDGAPLPGVMVVARGPVGTQTQYTGIDGSARFPGLYPGDYIATFSLDGFTTIIREGLTIEAQRTTAFTMEMTLATLEETVTVMGESPVVDVKSAGVAGLYTDDLIDKTPTASGLWAGVLDHVPGMVSSLDVGGGDSGQQTTPRAWGSESTNNSYNVNGGDTTDPAATGASSSYFSTSSFEEVSVSLAAQDIEIKTPGVNMNMVVKSGSNDWHAGVKYFYEGESLVSSNVDQDLMDQGITEGNPNELLSDLDIQGGGPIWRDRAWFFVDYWNFEIKKKVLGISESDGTKLRDWTLNLNGQINDNNKISGRYIDTIKYRNNRGASRNSPYLGRIQDSNTQIPQLQWQSVINQNVFSDIRFSRVRNNFPLVRRDGASSEAGVPYQNWSATYDFNERRYLRRPSNPTSEFADYRDTDNLNGTVSWYVTGENISHDIKFGASYGWINYSAPFNYPQGYRRYTRSNRDPMGNPNWMVNDPEDGLTPAVPLEVRLYNAPISGTDYTSSAVPGPDCFVLNNECWAPDNAYTIKGRAAGLFVQDTITIASRITLVGGLRWDHAYNWNPAQNRLDSPWCGYTQLNQPAEYCGVEFGEQDRPFTWSNLTPRIGVIYDIMGDGRWAAKFNYSRYAEALGTRFAGATNVNDVAREDWDWFDPNGDGLFQFGEQEGYRSSNYPGLGTAIDPDLQSPFVNEITAGVDHEIFDNVLFAVTAIWRGQTNDTGTVDIGRPFGPMFATEACQNTCEPVLPYGQEPYFPVQTVDPGNDGIIGTPDDGGPVTIYGLVTADPDLRGTNLDLTTNTPKYGFTDETDYKGVSFVVSKRWSNNWQVLASYDYGRGYETGGGTNPNAVYNNRRQQQFGSRPHNFKVTGNYLFAEPIGVNLGLFVRAQSGEPVRAEYTYDDSLLEPPNSPYGNQSNVGINVDARGEGQNGRLDREDFVTIVDVRAEKQVTVGRYGVLHFYFDVFNLFNSNVVTEFDWDLGSNYMAIQDILPPRVIRLGGAWDF